MLTTFVQIDVPALLGAALAALAASLIGNILVVTRRAMTADALSHVMLPGVAVAFLLTGSIATLPMLLGGLGASALATLLVAFLIRRAKVEPGAALGTVFTGLFAAGVVLAEQSGLSRTTFDVHHVIMGQIEGLIWPTATGPESLVSLDRLAELPDAIPRLLLVLLIEALIMALLFRRIAVAAFDPDFAKASGLPVAALDLAVLAMAALAAVATFQTVGVVLSVAMIVCPPATARLITTRLERQIPLTALIALTITAAGYALATLGPLLFGSPQALNASGTIGALSGVVLMLTAALRHDRLATAVRML